MPDTTLIDHIADLPHKLAYVTAWKRLKAMPVNGMVTLRRGESPRPVVYVRAEFRKCLDRRINSRAGNHAANVEMDIELVRDARKLDDRLTRRTRIYQFATPMMRKRFGHLLVRHDD